MEESCRIGETPGPIKVIVFREALPPEDVAGNLKLHNRRKVALHEVLDGEKAIKVEWGRDANDTRPHEVATILVSVVGPVVLKYAVVPGLKFIGKKLAEKLVDESTSAFVRWLLSKFLPKQQTGDIQSLKLTTPNGVQVTTCGLTPGAKMKVIIESPGKPPETIEYGAQAS